jgi:hypothetical protein
MPYREVARCHSAPHTVTPFVAVIYLTPVPLIRMTKSSWFASSGIHANAICRPSGDQVG